MWSREWDAGEVDLTLWGLGCGAKPWKRLGRQGNWLRTQARERQAFEAERQHPEKEENKGSQSGKTKAQESFYRRNAVR